MDEEERRRRAIAALREGRRPGDVCAELGRSRDGSLALLGRRLPLGRAAASEYVVATLSTGRGEIAVQVGEIAPKLFAFPVRERVVQPLRRGG